MIKSFKNKTLAILEWDMVSKSLLIIWVLFFFYIQSLLWSVYVSTNPEKIKFINQNYLERLIYIECIVLALCAGIMMLGANFRSKPRKHLLFQHIAIQFFSCAMLILAYSFGTLSYTVGIVLIGAPLLGFILLDRVAVWIAAALFMLVAITLTYASSAGLISYAPLINKKLAASHSIFWINTSYYLSLPFFIINTFIIDRLLVSWRGREKIINQLAITDGLTGLFNRRETLSKLNLLLTNSKKTQDPVSLIILDLDFFKKINDTYGHPAGDAVLCEAARVLARSIRAEDQLGRYGGEEFLILLPGATLSQACAVAERCRSALSQASVHLEDGKSLTFTASFGLVTSPAQFLDHPDSLIQTADAALYQAKAGGRNQVISVTTES